MDMNAHVYVKWRKFMQDSWAVFFDIHEQLLGPDHVARQTSKAERKLQKSHYGEKKGWDWYKYVTLHKEQYTIMESIADHGYNSIHDGMKVCHLLQGIKITELEAAVNVVWAQPEKYHKDFDTNVSYLGQMVKNKGCNMQFIHIAKTGSQPVKPKVAAFMWKIECKN